MSLFTICRFHKTVAFICVSAILAALVAVFYVTDTMKVISRPIHQRHRVISDMTFLHKSREFRERANVILARYLSKERQRGAGGIDTSLRRLSLRTKNSILSTINQDDQ